MNTNSGNKQAVQRDYQPVMPLVLMAQPSSTSAAAADPTASVAQGIKQTPVGGTFNAVPQYTAKSSSIWIGSTNYADVGNGYTTELTEGTIWKMSLKGNFTIDGSQVKNGRKILLGTILLTNNFYSDPYQPNHNLNGTYDASFFAKKKIIINGHKLGDAHLEIGRLNTEWDWWLDITSDETWVDDVKFSINLPEAGGTGYNTPAIVFQHVTKDKPWVETIQTTDHTYKFTMKLRDYGRMPTGWYNDISQINTQLLYNKYAPALQTSNPRPLDAIIQSMGKSGPTDATFGAYKYVLKVSGLGLPTNISNGLSAINNLWVVDQNNRLTDEKVFVHKQLNNFKTTQVANNLTAQQLYDQVSDHQAIYSWQDDGTLLLAAKINPNDVAISDDEIANLIKSRSIQYTTASDEDKAKILANNLAFYHGILKNTTLKTSTYFLVDYNRNSIIDRLVEDVTPSEANRPLAKSSRFQLNAASVSAKGDLLQHNYVYYIDGQRANTVINTTDLAGKAGDVKDVTVTIPAGYVLNAKRTGEVPASYTLKDGNNTPIYIYLSHQTTTVTPNQPKTPNDKLPDNPTQPYPSGVSQNDLNKMLTRTIQVVDPRTQAVTTTTQSVHLTRTATVDEVDGTVMYGKWTIGEWPTFNVPVVAGYTPSQTSVAKTTVTDTTSDQTVKITYTANAQSTTVNYVDQSGKTIHTTLLKGVTDQTVTVPNEVPDGWVAYSKDMPSRVVMGTRPAYIDYLIGHRLVLVKATDNVKAGDLIPGTKTKTFNDQVNADNLVTRARYTVNIWTDEAHTRKLATKTYHTDFVRNAVVDAVTGEVYYYNWSENGKHVFAGFTRPAGNGYQAVVVLSWTATPADPTKTIDLVAQPQQSSGTIQYQTVDGKVVSRQTFTGNNAVTLTAPTGYTLMTNVATITPALRRGQTYTVYVRPTQILYTAADQLPAGMASLRKTITRTIHITEANGHVRTITQRVHFTRTATVNADGEVTYADWQATGRAVMSKVFLPKRAGYHIVINGDLAKQSVTADMSDAVVNVKYVKD